MDELKLTDEEINDIVHKNTDQEAKTYAMGTIVYSIAQAQLDKAYEPAKAEGRRELIEWGDEICMEHGMKKRRRCDKCWQQLLKELGE